LASRRGHRQARGLSCDRRAPDARQAPAAPPVTWQAARAGRARPASAQQPGRRRRRL